MTSPQDPLRTALTAVYDGADQGYRLALMSEDGGVIPPPLPETFIEAVRAALRAAPAEPQPAVDVALNVERYGWHADGDLCLGSECLNIDEATGDHSTDVHSDEWWEGFAEAGRRILAPTATEPADGTLDEAEDQPPVSGGTTAIRDGQYVRELPEK